MQSFKYVIYVQCEVECVHNNIVFVHQTFVRYIYMYKVNVFSFLLQSTPVGSLQTGQEIVVSPNRDRHPSAFKVLLTFSSRFFSLSLLKHEEKKPKHGRSLYLFVIRVNRMDTRLISEKIKDRILTTTLIQTVYLAETNHSKGNE